MTRQLALFDAPIDPGLLIKAQAAGVDIGSVLSELAAPLPSYRFTALYPQALDFVNAVRAYGALFLAALEKSDAAQLAMLTANNQLQLLQRRRPDLRVADRAGAERHRRASAEHRARASRRLATTLDQSLNYPNTAEGVAIALNTASLLHQLQQRGRLCHRGRRRTWCPSSPSAPRASAARRTANAATGGKPFGDSFEAGAQATKAIADAIDKTAQLCKDIGKYQHSADDQFEKWVEAQMDVDRQTRQIAGASAGPADRTAEPGQPPDAGLTSCSSRSTS